MKLSRLFFMGIGTISMLVISCTTDLEFPFSKSKAIVASLEEFEDEVATRTLIGVDASDNLSYRWGVGDVLGIFPDQGTQVSFELSEASLSPDGLSATFDGGAWALKPGHSYYAYFPFSYGCFDQNVNKTNIPISYLGQKQVGFNDTSNAGQYDFNAAGASISNGGGVSFNFKRLGALLRVKFDLPATATYKTLTLTADGDVIPVTGTVDITSSTITYAPATYSNTLTVDLNNVNGTVGQTAYVYMMLPPMTLKTQGKTLTVTLGYDDKSTTYNICTAGTTTPNIPDFKANTRYKRDAVYLSGDPVGNMSGGNDEPEEHEYVDLGLPSGTLWATCNVGANAPEEYGDYFAWGETEPKAEYSWSTYFDTTDGGNSFSKYKNAAKTTLDSGDDAASVNWGGDWRMPTRAEQDELRSNCTWTWTTRNGVKGYQVTSNTNGNSIFLPAAGCRWDSDLVDDGSIGFYWSSSLNPDNNSIYSYFLNLHLNGKDLINDYRCDGRSVRPVQSKPHEYVDLGLSVKWATMNVGANAPEEYGDYFAWGEVEPYYTEGHAQDNPCSNWKAGKTGYKIENYKWGNGSDNTMTKYCTNTIHGTIDNKTTLEPEDDAANANWGGSWRMPTLSELDELYKNCTWTLTTQNGISGYIVTSKLNGNSIFLPAAGERYMNFTNHVGELGYYWSSSLYTSNSNDAYYLYFRSNDVDWYNQRRYNGRSVRPVCP